MSSILAIIWDLISSLLCLVVGVCMAISAWHNDYTGATFLGVMLLLLSTKTRGEK